MLLPTGMQGEASMDNRWWAGLVLVCCSFVASAGGGPGAVRKQTEASMLVTGTINVDQDGSVGSYAIDKREQVPAGVMQVIDATILPWRFKPVMQDGKPVRATAKMSLLIIASRVDQNQYRVTLRGATFGEGRDTPGEAVTAKNMRPPAYPSEPLAAGVTGSVYVVVRVGRQGTAEDAVVEQVNLRAVASEIEMERWRKQFAQAALSAARSWTFVPPTTGDAVDAPFWSVRVPINYQFEGTRVPKYGHWEAYIPGPRQTAPWVQGHEHDLDNWSLPDSQMAGGVYQVGKGLHLLTPPDQG
jgi:hypothetical protein